VIRPFVISREFDAPRDRVWRAWTEAERLKQWWGPKGFTVKQLTVDLRAGGKMHYCLQMPDGAEMWGLAVYREITKPSRLVWINRGSADGVQNSMAVISPRGVVGRVIGHPSARAARVQLIIDHSAAAGALT